MEEVKESITNEHDVLIEQVKAEVQKLQFELGSRLIKSRDEAEEKTKRLGLVVSSAERLALSAIIYATVKHVTDTRWNIVRDAFNADGE